MGALALIVIFLFSIFILKRLFSLRRGSKSKLCVAEDIMLSSRAAALFTGAFVYFLAPTGITAFFASPALIVVIAPTIFVFAAVSYIIYAFLKLAEKIKK